MGYESKFYIVEKGSFLCSCGKLHAEVIAMFDMCKCYALSDPFRRFPETDCCIYADDGDTEIVKDMYEDPLTETSIETTLRLVERAMEADSYRRYAPFEALLTLQAQEKEGKWGKLAVLHYGC